MDIKSFAELGKLVDVCRKKGVESIKVTADMVEIKLGAKPEKRSRSRRAASASDKIEMDAPLTDEQLATWSSAPLFDGEIGN